MPACTVTNTFGTQSATITLGLLDVNFTDLTTFTNSTLIPFITATAIPSFVASKAQQQTATISSVYITSGNQYQNLSSPKAWATWDGTATGTVSAISAFKVTRIVRNGTGTYNIVLAEAMASTAWAGLANSGESGKIARCSVSSVSDAVCIVFDLATAPTDPTIMNFIAFGTLA